MGHPLAYFEITSNKAEELQKFYKELLGWKVQVFPEMGGYGVVDTNSGEGSVSGGIGPVMRQAGVTIYFYSPDLQKTLDEAVRLGGTQVMEPTPIPGFGNFAIFTDPDGNQMGLWDRQSA